MYTDKGLEFLASAVGKPVRLHPKTETCVTFEEAQMLVEADLTKDLPKEFIFTGEEEGELDVVIKYSYPWLPPRCNCCKKWGHLNNSCLAALVSEKIIDTKSPVEQADLQNASEEKSSAEQAGPQHVPDLLLVAETEEKDVDTPAEEVFEVSKRIETVESDSLVPETNDKDQDWITPTSSRRSPKRMEELKFGEVSLLTNSYSALSGEGDLSEITISTDQNDVQETELIPAGNLENSEMVIKPRGTRMELPLRQSLPRGTKAAQKPISSVSNQSTRGLPKDQTRKFPPKH